MATLFPPQLIVAAALFSLFSAVLISPLEARGLNRAALGVMVLALLASAYCVGVGLDLLVGWEDPFAQAAEEDLTSASARGRGRGGILILGIRYLPWVLIVGGAYLAYQQGQIVRSMLRQL